MDETAARDLGEVQLRLDQAGLSVLYANLTYDEEGRLASGIFEVGCASTCSIGRYIYDAAGAVPDKDWIGGTDIKFVQLSESWIWYQE